MQVRPESLSTVRLELFFHDVPLGYGTGFLYQFGQYVTLVTNWHVLAGRNPLNGAYSENTQYVPNLVKFNLNIENQEGSSVTPRYIELELIKNGDPIWIETEILPSNGGEMPDVAAIILNDQLEDFADIGSRIVAMSSIAIASRGEDGEFVLKFPYPKVGSDVFIVGFPNGLVTQGVLPIWKRGSVATEPLHPVLGKPVFLIDATTRSGMSGSPIIYFGKEVTDEDGTPLSANAPDDTMWLMGIYAGRNGVSQEEYSMALGRGWRREVIDQLFIRPRPGGSQVDIIGTLKPED
jgi:hypothetical protein